MQDLQAYDLTFGGILRKLDGALPKEWHDSLATQVHQIRAVLGEYQAHVTQIVQSGDYSPQGRAKRLADLGRQYATKLAAHRKLLAAYDERVSVEQHKLNGLGTRSRDDVLLAELRSQEVRRWAREEDPLKLQEQYLSMASDTRRHDAMRALEGSPLPLLSDEVLAQGQALRTKHLAPEAVQTLEHLGTMRKTVSDAIDSALAFVQPDGDPLHETATRGATTG
jgi:hypothetical protein